MNKGALILLFFCFFFVLFSPGLSAQPTEKSLLDAWELVQKNDPKTILFEKLDERRYRFKTRRFPFDGEIKIFNVIVEGGDIVENKEIYRGIIELELVGVPENFSRKYHYSYSGWRSNNWFHFDPETREWMSNREFRDKQRKEFRRPRGD